MSRWRIDVATIDVHYMFQRDAPPISKEGGSINMTSGFFEERTETSTVKATIVQKYFDAWSKIILPTAEKFHGGKIAYVDLYAGPGRYRDGAASTPLLILEKALEAPRVAAALIAMFNDHDENNTQTLARLCCTNRLRGFIL
jgi:hypothetical protein